MNEQIYKLLITVLGALIPGLFGIINTIITLRAKSGQGTSDQTKSRAKPQPTQSTSQKGRPRMLLIMILIAIGAVAGYYIGNRTQKNPNIVKLYSQDEQRAIASERVTDIEFQINGIEQEIAHIQEQPDVPESEKEKRINRLDETINQLMMEKVKFEEIGREIRTPEDRLEP